MTTSGPRRGPTSDDWWDDLDGAVLDALTRHGARSPEAVGRLVGVSAAAANSLLAMLAQEGRVRIALVEAVTRRAVVAA